MNKAFVFIAWSLLIGMLSFSWWAFVSEDLTEIEELGRTYQRKQLLLQRLDQLPKKEELIKRRLADLGNDAATRFLYDGDDNRIRSELQRDIRQIASDADVRINQMRPLRTPRSDSILMQVPVQITFECTQEELLRFISVLEGFEPMLNIGKLNVRVQNPSEVSRAAQLAVTAEVNGYYQSGRGISDE